MDFIKIDNNIIKIANIETVVACKDSAALTVNFKECQFIECEYANTKERDAAVKCIFNKLNE